jgi:small acid-soluble spore protein H (minor)
LDSIRAKQIIDASGNIQVLYNGSPVWLENVNNNDTVRITYLDTNKSDEVPAYKLVENNPDMIR